MPDGRDLRGDAARAVRAREDPPPGQDGPLGLPLLRRRLPGGFARRRRQGHARHLSGYRARHSQPGLDLREGPVRLRLSPAPRSPHEAADPQGLGEGAGPLGLARGQRCESPGRAVADHRGGGPEPEAGGPAALGGKGGARPAAAGARGPGHSGPGRDPAVLVRAVPRAHERGATLIVADPRKTELAGRADIHLQMQPGTDVALFNAMLHHIVTRGLEDKGFVAERMHDFEKVRESVKAMTPDVAAKITGVPADRIRWAAEIYAQGPRTSTLWAMGLTQHANGTDLVTSLLNLMLACGMIGRWGAAMMPVRGQNNVQGASDVGAIPFVYTDYRPVRDPRNRAEYAEVWGVAAESLSLKEGLMVTEIVKEDSGVRGMYVMGENPIISDPDIAHAEHWFQELEFLAVQDLFLTETARYADVVLPGSSFAEKKGTFVNTERRIQLTHQAVDSPGEARADLEILMDLTNRLGLPTTFDGAEAVMQEIAQVTPSWAGVTYERLEGAGLQYPVPDQRHPGTAFLFDKAFPTADGRATFVPVEYTDPVELPDDDYPSVINTGRQLYHWHTGTMSRRASGLDAREPTAIVEIHPEDARKLGVREGELVRLTSRRNSMVSAARVSERVARGQVFVPFHFREAAANLLTNPVLDPYAKMAELKICAVRIEKA